MTLSADTAIQSILNRTDSTQEGFVGWPMNDVQVVTNWAAMAREFFQEMVAPPLPPAAHAAAELAFIAAGSSLVKTAFACLDAGFAAYASALVPFALPAVAVPPPQPLASVSVMTGFYAEPVTPAGLLGTRIYTWAITGTFTVPPAPAVSIWS